MILRAFQLPRIDRLATVYVCHPLAKLTGWSAKYCVPVLTYHSISENLFGKVHPYHHINTPVSIFSLQMRWLRQAGYRTISLTELMNGFETTQDLSKTVVLTFDDGYQDFFTDAFPILKQCGFMATVFLATDRIRDESVRVEGADYLTWNEVRELQAEGITFGSHSVTHPDLRSLGPEQIDYELGYSKETIEQRIGAPGRTLSLIHSHFRKKTVTLSGIWRTRWKTWAIRMVFLQRSAGPSQKTCVSSFHDLSVNSWDDLELLKAKVEGGYDWLHWPQWFYKFAHHNVALMTGRSLDQVEPLPCTRPSVPMENARAFWQEQWDKWW